MRASAQRPCRSPEGRRGAHIQTGDTFTLHAQEGALWITAADGGRLHVLAATLAGQPLRAADVPAALVPD